MRLSGLFLLAALAATTWAAELTRSLEPPLWRFSRPDAQMLVGINWRKLANTEPGRMLQEQLKQAGLTGGDDSQTLNAIDQVLISSLTAGEKDKSEPPTVITLKGRFNLVKLRALALNKKATIKPYKLIEIISPAQAQPGDLHVALVSADTIVLGDRASLLAAIDNSREPAIRISNPLYLRALELTSRHDLWFATVAPASLAAEKGPASLLKEVKVIDGGLNSTDKMRLELNLTTASDADATALAGVANAMLTMMPAEQRAKLPAGDLLKSVSIQSRRRQVQMALSVEMKDMKKGAAALGPMMGNLVAGNFDLKGIALPAPEPPAEVVASAVEAQPTFKVQVEAKAPEPAFVKIYGLEGGTRTVRIQ